MSTDAQAGARPAYENVSGNYCDKYNTKNPVARWLMDGFFRSFDALVAKACVRKAFEVGGGEGHLTLRMTGAGFETLVGRHADVVELRQPLPWTMTLARTDR